ncbi:TPA: Shedu immune nuclease family protein [Vibrio parahaemolyticus]|uniref:Shedu immune nuclease family protein n=2 Tax=Vibrio parahaemolyticus TaxID=670 RepID=UPI001121AD54|nr:Shedu immune nuclease family protein [Vibrio parahaemolyticus]EIA3182955.1 DUF4263 domain-containing protein [Vibrio parahaemolyticus]MDG2995333.1 DUF4263 domain-containing protein [Vibrio parahaemolyticus]TOG00546.1 hypothetical protein CGJ10_11680 [Vibrio parahaemolyticus]HCG7662218.1 DUF4263 domain-containing protein [Vibrio parahaemolyticus]
MNDLIDLVDKKPLEQPVQEFLEKNPAAICGANYVLGRCVISKLPLGNEYKTDFAYVNPQSGCTFLHLVEIEKPDKSIFTKNDEFTKEFNQALQQVNDWLFWCANNSQYLYDFFEPLRQKSGDSIGYYNARGLLIYGRNSEINNVRRKERWSQKTRENNFIEIRTYDGFAKEMNSFLPPNTLFNNMVDLYHYVQRDFKPKKMA